MKVMFQTNYLFEDRLCGLVVRVPGHRSRGPEFNSPELPDCLRSSGMGIGSLALVTVTEKILE
jgi:hypothetical protein